MAPTEASPERLGPADVAGGLRLSALAGWNQSADDWSLMLALGQGWGLRRNGRLVATACILPHGPRLGWVSLVLVDPAWRRRGFATVLFDHAVARLEATGRMAVLDATPDGREVYLRRGFRDGPRLTRWRRPAADVARGLDRRAHLSRSLLELDARAFGADRRHLLRRLVDRGSYGRAEPGGFLVTRRGPAALQIGPVVSEAAELAQTLLAEAFRERSEPLVLDLPDARADLAALAGQSGFTAERPFIRMARGGDPAFGDPSLVAATAGPELG